MKRGRSKFLAVMITVVMLLQQIPLEAFAVQAVNPGGGSAVFDSVTPPENLNESVAESVYEAVYKNELDNQLQPMALEVLSSVSNNKEVLLIQSKNPWNTTSNDQVLNQLNLSYDKITVDTAVDCELEQYKLIIIANDQYDSFYRTLSTIRTKLERYVMNGGTLLYGICDAGWGAGYSDLLIPGDIRLQPVNYSYYNYINEPNHPIITGELTDGNPLTNSDLYNNYTSHRCFEKDSLPYDAKIILHAGSIDKPTLVEYPIGDGMVIASGLTWEFSWAYRMGNDGYGTFGRKAFDDLIAYAYRIAGTSGTTGGLGLEGIDDGTSCAAGEPVNVVNGNFYTRHKDISIEGHNPIELVRFYNSMDSWEGSLGAKWHHNYEIKLKEVSGRRVRITFEDGHTEDFIFGDDGIWYAMPGKYNKIAKLADGTFKITKKDGVSYSFDSFGTLTIIEDLKGNMVKLSYNSGRLVKVESTSGYIMFEYDGNLIKRVSDSTGRNVEYGYTGNCLTSVKDVEGNTTRYEYDDEGRIKKIIDSLDNVKLENIYDGKGRVVEQTMADGSTCSFSYDDTSLTTEYIERNGARTVYIRDSNNRINERAYVNGTEKLVFNEKNQITAFTDKNGNTYYYEYDDNGNITRETNPLGLVTEYSYDKNNKITSLCNPDGSTYEYTYDEKGNMLTAKDPLGRTLSIEYNDKGLPVKVILPNGAFSTLQYDDKGNPAIVTDPDGNISVYTYDGINRIKTITKPNGSKIKYEYTASGKVKKIINPDGTYSEAVYYSRGLLAEEKDANGSVTKYKYNAIGKPVEKIDALNNTTRYEYDSMWNISKIILPDGSTTTYSYNQANQLQSITDAVYAAMNFEYDANGNLLKATDPMGNTTRYSYDALNRLVKTIDANNAQTSYEYGLNGKLKKIVDALNNVSEYEYDAAGQLVKTKDALGNTTAYTYNSLGYVETVTDAKGAITKYDYNSNGSLIKVTLPDGTANIFEYDANGNLIKATDATGNSTQYTYDSMDRVKTVTDALGGTKTFEYKNTSKISTFTDENSNKTQYRYDALDRLTQVIDAKGSKTSYIYDSVGNLTEIHQYGGINKDVLDSMKKTSVKDAVYNPGNIEAVTKYIYDPRGLLTREINPAGKVTVYGYDANGNLISKTDRDNLTTKYDYDPAGNLKKVTYNDGKQVEYQYDPFGQVTGMTDWLGNTNFELDALGRVLKVTDYKSRVTEYTWSPVGEKTSIKYPDGTTVKYGYDIMGRLIKVNDAKNKAAEYKYDSLGNVIEKILPNGIKTIYKYDAISRVQQLKNLDKAGKTMDDFTYTYDAAGNKIRINRKHYGEKAFTSIFDETEGETGYKYDVLNQLVEVNKPNKTKEKYFYDKLGNRVRHEYWLRNKPIHAENYKYDTENHLTEITGNGLINAFDKYLPNKVQMEYDNRGNLTKTSFGGKTLAKYTFNAANKLSEVTNMLGEKTSFTYDGLGRRAGMEVQHLKFAGCHVNLPVDKNKIPNGNAYGWWKKQQKTEKVSFLTDIISPYNDILMTYTEGVETQKYTYGLDMLSMDIIKDACKNKDERLYYSQDELGSPVRITDEKGRTQERYSYDEFGRPVMPRLYSGWKSTDNTFGFTGYQYDASTGLYFAQARYYMPEVGRFISEDGYKGNITNTQILNLYIYCSNNPILYVDPNGYEKIVLSGSEYDTGRFKYNFIEPAIKRLKEHRFINPKDKNITWIISKAGYTDTDINNFEKTAKHFNVNIVFIDTSEELMNYINYKSKTIDKNNICTDEREEDKITSLDIFSHGLPGSIALGYNQNEREQLELTKDEIDLIISSSFDNPITKFYSCNTGTIPKGQENSFVQDWVNKTGGFAVAVVNGTTTYKNIAGLEGTEGFWKWWYWDTKRKIKDLRKETGYMPSGSINYPVASKGVKWKIFMPN